MVAINFPDSPTNGQEHAGYVWDATNNVWNRLPTLPALDLVNFSAVAPSNPQDGQFWFDTTVAKMYVYYNDGSSSQWVSTIGGFNELNAIDDVVISSATAGQALTYDGTNWVNGGAGKILQVVSTTKTDTFTLASGSFTDVTNFSATITPSSATSKVLVMVAMGGRMGTEAGSAIAKLIRNDTDLSLGNSASGYTQATFGGYEAGFNQVTYPITYLDSPATTSSTTYKVALKVSNNPNGGSVTFILNEGSGTSGGFTYGDLARVSSTITLMEVAS